MPTTCEFGAVQNASDTSSPSSALPTRRRLLTRSAVGMAGLTCGDFLGHFLKHGQPTQAKAAGLTADRTADVDDPHFLIYWFLEGGWMGYDMFNPVVTDNNVQRRLDDISRERYRVLKFGQDGYRIKRDGDIRYGYLAESGKPLFGDLAVLASMHTGSSHSSERLKAHMGSYRFRNTHEREDDERSVLHAFAEAYGQPYLLPHLSWHWWLSDGELNEAQYTGRRGYYHALGPVHAHTIYAGTPRKLKSMLMRIQSRGGSGVDAQVQAFLDSAGRRVLDDESNEAVKSYHSARMIYRQLVERGRGLDKAGISQLFTDEELRSRFNITPGDELITYRSVNGNKARSKFSPNTNVQAMMTYEMMRAGLSCAFWIESRDIRRFDSHRSRSKLWKKDGTPIGQADQTEMLRADLWQPLLALVDLLKTTEYGQTGKSLYDLTTIVLTSEFGRTIHGSVASIDKMKISDEEKAKKIGGQDISQHWRVTSSAFLGGRVKGGTQYGNAGQKTLEAIPLMPDGSTDPAYDPLTGELIDGRHKDERSIIPNHGNVYATALALSGLNPKGRGRNDRPPLHFIQKA